MIGKSKGTLGALITALVVTTSCLALVGSATIAYGQPGWTTDKKAVGKDVQAAKSQPAKAAVNIPSTRGPVSSTAQGWQRAPGSLQRGLQNWGTSNRGPLASTVQKPAAGPAPTSDQRSGWGRTAGDGSTPTAARQPGWFSGQRAPSAPSDRPSTWGGAAQPGQRSGWGGSDSRTILQPGKQPTWGTVDRAPAATVKTPSSWGSSNSKTILQPGKQPAWGSADRTPPAVDTARSGWGSGNSKSALQSAKKPAWGSADRTPAATDKQRAGWNTREPTNTTGAGGWMGKVTSPKAPVVPARQRTITVQKGWLGQARSEVRHVPEPSPGWTAARHTQFAVGLDIRHNNTSLWFSLSNFRRTWGDPGYFYRYSPYGHHGPPVSIHYYYPWYYYRPGPLFFDVYQPYYGYYYPAPFCTYGWFSFWLPASVVIIEHPVVLIDTYWHDDGGYYADEYSVPDSARNAARDIRDAWLDNRPELIQDHLQQYGKVRIYFQGRYAYSLTGEDYYQMVQDAFSTLRTQRFELGRVRSRARDEVFVSARHQFVDPDGEHRTVQLGYALQRSDGTWYITRVDSSSRYLEIRDRYAGDNYDN